MKIELTGRHVEITPRLRTFVEERLHKLAKLLDEPIHVHVVLSTEKHRHEVEILVHSRTATLSGRRQNADLLASIRDVVEALERQALRHKEKITERKRREAPRKAEMAAQLERERERGEPGPAGRPVPRVLRSPGYRLKPLSLEDALAELEASGDDILVFRESDSGRIGVLYRRRDGDWGLIEPEF